MTEAKATLPMIEDNNARLDDVFTALNSQKIRLKYDQQIPVWGPYPFDRVRWSPFL